jgi:sulfoxide reductase heme-binding subunit YedZ
VTAVLAAAGPSAYWYLTRGTGAVALVLLTASVVLGVLDSIRFASAPRWPRFAIDAMHRDVSLLVIVFLAVHIITSVLDSFAPVKLVDAFIPLTSSYRPLWLGLGALSFDLLLALVVTSLMRRRLGFRTWRRIHWLAYASWPVAVLHGLGTGSDTKVWWMLGLTAICSAAVLIAVWTRIERSSPASTTARNAAVVASVLTPVGIAIFTLVGPLQSGWAGRAGTPVALLGKSFAPAAARTGAPGTNSGSRGPFSASLAGTIKQTPEPGGAVVDLALRLSGGARGRLRVRIAGAPMDNGGLSMTGSQVVLTASGIPSVLEGRIISLQGQQFVARVAGGGGSAFDLRANLNIDSQAGAVTGTLAASPTAGGGQ